MHIFFLFATLLLFLKTICLPVFAEESLEKDITIFAGPVSFVLQNETIQEWQQKETQIVLNREYRSEWENISSHPSLSSLSPAFFSERDMRSQRKEIIISTKKDPIKQFLFDLQKQFDRDSTLSTVAQRENSSLFLFTPGEEGIRILVEKNIPLLEAVALNPSAFEGGTVSLETEVSSPSFSEEAKSLGITDLLGQGTSNFSGSSTNRIFNIRHALERFDSVLVQPGEVFSFTKTLGEVEESTGYRPELVIRKNRTEPEFGGGICQVSTTFFRAAVNAGLEISERSNHSYPVRYYTPIGFDATVYFPRPDLQVKNNFDHNILFVPSINGKKLIFDVYGTSDGRTVSVTNPVVTERGEDGSLKTEFTQSVLDRNGNLVFEKVFASAYDSPAKYPHPEDIVHTKKPKDWSKREWEKYKKEKGI